MSIKRKPIYSIPAEVDHSTYWGNSGKASIRII